jgi:glycosyltransferase involved in cell wall biosynthesis
MPPVAAGAAGSRLALWGATDKIARHYDPQRRIIGANPRAASPAMSGSDLVARWRSEFEDLVHFNPAIRRAVAWAWRSRAIAGRRSDNTKQISRIRRLCSAATLTPSNGERLRIERLIREAVAGLNGQPIDWKAIYPETAKPWMFSAAILKPNVSEREKGVLLVSFEKQWTKLLCFGDAREIAARYTLIIGPSWTPPHGVGVTVFPERYPDPVFSTISHADDIAALPRLSRRIVPLPLLASNWVDPDDFAPLPREKRDIDIVMVATFGRYKRHHALLKALSRMPANLRVQLVGTDNEDLGARGVWELARAYGVADRLVEVGAADYAGVARAFARAKVSVITSRREGSCQAVVESMFADTPVGILDGAYLGSRVYLNEHTGRFLREGRLAEDLMALLAGAAAQRPREWVMQNDVSCHASTRILNGILRDHALVAGQEWTRDIVAHAWNPYPELIRAEDKAALRGAYCDFYQRFGLQVGPDPARWTP